MPAYIAAELRTPDGAVLYALPDELGDEWSARFGDGAYFDLAGFQATVRTHLRQIGYEPRGDRRLVWFPRSGQPKEERY
jgi:hypothetical protein